MKKVLLFYKYVAIDDPEKFKKDHLRMCKELDINGRIIVAKEGINGTVDGEPEAIEKYKQNFWNDERFRDIEFKEREEHEEVFPKMSIKVRDEIVALKQEINLNDPNTKRGIYIEPEDFNTIIKSDDEYYIVDVRNNYESYIGKFKDSIALDIDNFRDLPKGIEQIADLKKKKVITVCTGGIRCEKATAYLLKEGFEQVYQLHGGIVKYGKIYPDEGFEGKCYVFDGRVAVDINSEENKKTIAVCLHCNTPCDRYINCCNAECNKQFVCCNACEEKYEQGCSEDCQQKSRYKSC